MRGKRLIAAVLSGLALPATVLANHQFTRVAGSDLQRLRGDASRVGADFSNVIAREHGYSKKIASKTRASDSGA